MERLTPAEEKVMLRLWKLEKSTVKEIVDLYPNPKPAYNTVSTIVRILERKKFIKHKPMGRGYIYLPKISRDQYRDYLADYILKDYFDGSRNEIVSFYNSTASLSEIL
ncbi:BlaI/MecI/CopY family transcriptional regulator [Fluviicola taffensis]|uniref:Transcriptional repressor, CopY family n=1 Tax=Fluviicola taffensis (strain DSM 16823 / NCIMB 13979 / RW262) TaxID=755732 RepID=F2IF86_FLUTR|nr:BlaI/MecI/CopY family transcriptional regulator [Fluviicola taffensis]AEA43560.1 transcriptional repressor, CopY family [Fluviicola taffensis DSM 16823]